MSIRAPQESDFQGIGNPRRFNSGGNRSNVEIVTGPLNQKGFIVQKRRWVVERTFAWIGRNRRLAKDYERQAATAFAFVFLAGASVLLKRVEAVA